MTRIRLFFILTLSLFIHIPLASQVAAFDHSLWNELLQKHVIVRGDSSATQVDYGAMAKEREKLQKYLQKLSAVGQKQFEGWDKNTQLAFLINAYNGWTVELILTRYPDIKSIKDLGSLFQSPWKKKFIPLFNNTISLDTIEHELIRGSGRYQEPRIHFAVNCASIGCPALRNEAYQEDQLNTQLEEATRLFLSDTSRNRLRDNQMEVSSIFKWYKDDFTKGWRQTNSLSQFLALYATALTLSPEQEKQLRADKLSIRFLDYDWNLNGGTR